eukprot:Polyplicarium_translucidae@DN3042_c0_g1_i6.p1
MMDEKPKLTRRRKTEAAADIGMRRKKAAEEARPQKRKRLGEAAERERKKSKLSPEEREAYLLLRRLRKSVRHIHDEPETAEGEHIAVPLTADLSDAKTNIADCVALLGNWKVVKRLSSNLPEERRAKLPSRTQLVDVVARDVSSAYGYSFDLAKYLLEMFSPREALEYIESSEKPRPVTLRTNTLKTRRKELARTLISKGANLDPVGDWCRVGLKVYDSTIPLGATSEYCAGHYMVQAAASFLPVMALDPRPGEMIMKNKGVLFCNDASKERLVALNANLQRLGVSNAVVSNLDGKKLPGYLPKLDRVLLDAPCTGSGIAARDASVKFRRGPGDFETQSKLQKVLLAAAVDIVDACSKTGGVIVYSTCSISIEENEAVIDHVLKTRNVKLVDTGIPFGSPGLSNFRDRRFHPSIAQHAKRVYPHSLNLDGFFVAKLRKFSNDIPQRVPKNRSKHNSSVKIWGEEQWQPELLQSFVGSAAEDDE